MTTHFTTKNKKCFLIILNVIIIALILTGFISLIVIQQKIKIDPLRIVGSHKIILNNNHFVVMNDWDGWTMDYWERGFSSYLIVGWLLYGIEVFCLMINNKWYYSLFPLFYIKKLNISYEEKWKELTILIISLFTFIMYFVYAITMNTLSWYQVYWKEPQIPQLVFSIVLLIYYLLILLFDILNKNKMK
ncbi:hypothetical protein [Mycoplasmopsis verecunda]|uniref:Uncharacterized protein n=1 Tax=Mycoplasmopsis verecunda TaxID=171291 RepID=A0A1T4KSN2_9BACT|nr:hypothetical protein [Mycoplasmopsis verecunda]WPB54670.1 hypothetical protein SAM46_00710 [Mycoplasmopsis verecunda]SJZ45449.1 hypothetical protein SAMN02745154_00162 [Mycoplasmopsis verecunda]